jgi:hypothetical protein
MQAPGTLRRDGPFGVIVLAPGSAEPQTLAGSGIALWHALAEPRSDAELAELLAREFHVDPALVLSDIRPVVNSLSACGALVEAR